MKRFIALLLCAVMCFSFVSCESDVVEKVKDKDKTEFADTTAEEEETEVVDIKNKVFSWEEFNSFITVVELTMDNWEDYFEIVELEEVTPAEFEDEEPDIERDLYVKLKDKNACGVNVAMRFTFSEAMTQNQYNADTKELMNSSVGGYDDEENTASCEVVGFGGSVCTLGNTGTCTYRKYEHEGIIYETILDVTNIECVKVAGKIYIVTIPEEAWNTTRLGEKSPSIQYERDGEVYTVVKDGVPHHLREIFES